MLLQPVTRFQICSGWQALLWLEVIPQNRSAFASPRGCMHVDSSGIENGEIIMLLSCDSFGCKISGSLPLFLKVPFSAHWGRLYLKQEGRPHSTPKKIGCLLKSLLWQLAIFFSPHSRSGGVYIRFHNFCK